MIDFILRSYFKKRQKKVEYVAEHPMVYQNAILEKIIQKNKSCVYGVENRFELIRNYSSYTSHIPIVSYEDISPLIKKMMGGIPNILCSDPIHWFAKSSGSSDGRSKYIPVSKKYLRKGHLKCAWDAASIIYNEDSTASLFKDRSLIMGGSIEKINAYSHTGDISAIILHHFPKIGRSFYTPDFTTALMAEWDKKIKKIATITSKQNVTLLAGVPTWTLVLFKEIIKQTGKKNISEVWPNLRSYLHGGVNFQPYRKEFEKYLPTEKLIYREVYNASEGYFALQNEKDEEGMLLLCNHEIFYEFIPQNENKNQDPICLQDVQTDQVYELLISNTSGLYRYKMGDLVQFVRLKPYKLIIVGRTHQQINVFGEELSIDNVSRALAITCEKYNAQIYDFTVAPIFLKSTNKGSHEWWIEFSHPPNEILHFANSLDTNLRKLNSDYDAKRSNDLALENLKIKTLEEGTFDRWLKQKGKYQAQQKIPKLKNDRSFVNELNEQLV